MKRVPLTRGAFALVDDRDFHRASALKWYLFARKGRPSYAWRTWRKNGERFNESLHAFVLGTAGQVDHRNGNGLDCRRRNLRVATATQQRGNQPIRRDSGTGFKGVQPNRTGGKFNAHITAGGVRTRLGSFATPKAAARAYDAAARRVFGAFACVNFPRCGERSARRSEGA